MTDDLDDLVAEAEAADAVEGPTSELALTDVIADVLRSLPDVGAGFNLKAASLEERAAVADARAILDAVGRAVKDRVNVLDLAIKRAAIEMGADEIKTADGHISVADPRGVWATKPDAMKDALLVLTHDGHLTAEEVEDALETIITVKPNHTKLNKLAKHRGEAVEQAIESNREKVAGDPLAAKITFHTDNRKAAQA